MKNRLHKGYTDNDFMKVYPQTTGPNLGCVLATH